MSDYKANYDYFNKYRIIKNTIIRLEERLETIHSKYELQAQKYSTEPTGKGGKPASYETMMIQTERLEEQLKQLYKDADQIKANFDEASIMVDNQVSMRVIELYFFDCVSQEEIADQLHLSTTRVSQLKREGLEKISIV